MSALLSDAERSLEPWGGFHACNTTQDCYLPVFEGKGRGTYACLSFFNATTNEPVGLCKCFTHTRMGPACEEFSTLTWSRFAITVLVFLPIALRGMFLAARAMMIHFEYRYDERMELGRINLILVTLFIAFMFSALYSVMEVIDVWVNTTETKLAFVWFTGTVIFFQYFPICLIIMTWTAILKSSIQTHFGNFEYRDRTSFAMAIVVGVCLVAYAVIYLVGGTHWAYSLLLIVLQCLLLVAIMVMFISVFIRLRKPLQALRQSIAEGGNGASKIGQRASDVIAKKAIQPIRRTSVFLGCVAGGNIIAMMPIILYVYMFRLEASVAGILFGNLWVFAWSTLQVALILLMQVGALQILLRSGKLTNKMHFWPSRLRKKKKKKEVSKTNVTSTSHVPSRNTPHIEPEQQQEFQAVTIA